VTEAAGTNGRVLQPRERLSYSPIVDRPRISWPGDARVAVWVVPNVEHYEYLPPVIGGRDPWPGGPHPDVRAYSHRDYGNRVGLWRFAELFDRLGIRPTVSLNVAVLDHYPQIRDALAERAWELMAHGAYNTRYLYGMSAEEEDAFFVEMVETVQRHGLGPLKGFLGPLISGTERTPDLVARHGLLYHADWVQDDQPVPIRVEEGRLISVPYTFELNDAPLFREHFDGEYYEAACKAQFDRLWREGESTGMVMCLAVHPFLVGQPHLIGHFAAVLEHIAGHDGVWWATGGEIAQHYLDNHYDDAVRAAVPHAGRFSHD
jgi:allantoinase